MSRRPCPNLCVLRIGSRKSLHPWKLVLAEAGTGASPFDPSRHARLPMIPDPAPPALFPLDSPLPSGGCPVGRQGHFFAASSVNAPSPSGVLLPVKRPLVVLTRSIRSCQEPRSGLRCATSAGVGWLRGGAGGAGHPARIAWRTGSYRSSVPGAGSGEAGRWVVEGISRGMGAESVAWRHGQHKGARAPGGSDEADDDGCGSGGGGGAVWLPECARRRGCSWRCGSRGCPRKQGRHGVREDACHGSRGRVSGCWSAQGSGRSSMSTRRWWPGRSGSRRWMPAGLGRQSRGTHRTPVAPAGLRVGALRS